MLLTVTDVEGLPEGLQEVEGDKSKKSAAQTVMVAQYVFVIDFSETNYPLSHSFSVVCISLNFTL